MAKRKADDGASPLERANEVGYLGTKVDPTPNESYTVDGVTSGAETPETAAPGSPGSTKGDPEAITTGTGLPVDTSVQD